MRTTRNDRQPEVTDIMTRIASACAVKEQSNALFEQVLTLVREAIPYDAATIYLFNRTKERFEAKASLGRQVESLSFLEFYHGDGLTGWAAEHKRSLLLKDRSAKSNFDPETDYATFLSVPLQINETVTGVLNIGCHRPYALDDADVALASALANQVAVGLEIASVRTRCEELAAELEEIKQKLSSSCGSVSRETKQEVGQEVAVTYNEINNFLSVITGNMECLIAEDAVPTQKSLSRLRRTIDAAARLGQASQNILKIKRIITRCSTEPGQRGLAKPKDMVSGNV